jgi:hypothetical protein
VNHVGLAADGTVFDVLLLFTLRNVDRDDNLFAARAANVADFVVHGVMQLYNMLGDGL